MEVVINVCFGGFGLSNEAVYRLIKKGSKVIKKYHPKDYYGGDAPLRPNEKWEEEYKEDVRKAKPFRDGYKVGDKWGGLFYKAGNIYTDVGRVRMNRSDKDLIVVVKELGKKADGYCAELKIVKIPDGVDYTIEEYDGLEHIAEKHRTWR